ncbi:MAG: hypothetical protein V2I46_06635, partial [Bacteroides sp.]|nr:hypothetical protein [Bacteroides sp.]
NNAPSSWFLRITLLDGYTLSDTGFLLFAMGDGFYAAVDAYLPESINFPDDYFNRKPAEGSNTYTLYLSTAPELSGVDFTNGFYVSAFVEYVDSASGDIKSARW